MHIYFGRINENQEPKDQFLKGFYSAQKGSSYFGALNQFDSFDNEDVYVFMLGKTSVELWKAKNWGSGGNNLYFDKTHVNLHDIDRAWFAAFKFFYLDADLIVFTTRRPYKKAFFELKVDAAFTRKMLLDHNTYKPDSNFRHIEIHNSTPTGSSRNLAFYKHDNKWQFKEPEFYDTSLTQYFRDNAGNIGKGRPNKDSILTMIQETTPLPAVYNPDQLTLLNIYDVFFCDYNGSGTKSELTDDIDEDDDDSLTEGGTQPLNTILYGPPGTGKTYNTIIKAAEIITGEKQNYDKAKELYDSLIGDQIEFITFHQNYSYEDFVIGLRPETTIKSQLVFKEHKGIFYTICERAKENLRQSSAKGKQIPAFDDLLKTLLEPLDEEDGKVTVSTLGGKSTFELFDYDDTHIDYKKAGKRERRRRIQRIKNFFEDKLQNVNGGPDDYHQAVAEELKRRAAKSPLSAEEVSSKNYVLIIDEINRANISRVFGELITLIEDDKRMGNKHEMKITLSNGEKFTVPKNLYIIGTMNTADKSIALIDIALRRRFVFEAMYPDLSKVDSPYKEFLEELNKVILDKKGADFMIGHSYLMPDEISKTGFVNIMNHQIIPLLNEYFYNNRSITVQGLLQTAIAKAGNYEVVVNAYKEVICQPKP